MHVSKILATVCTAAMSTALILGATHSMAQAAGTLPLKHGRYVWNTSPCSEDATATSVRYNGSVLGWGHQEDHIRKVARHGNGYDVEFLAVGDGGMGGNTRAIRHEYFVIPDSTHFHQRGGVIMRWCDALP